MKKKINIILIVSIFVSLVLVNTKIKLKNNNILNLLKIKDNLFLLDVSESEETNQVTQKLQEIKKSNQALKDQIKSLNEELTEVSSLSMVDKAYPIGSIYISYDLETPEEVAEKIGGEWVAYGDGRTLRSSVDDSKQTNDSIGRVTLTESNLPSHSHSFTPSGSISALTFTGSAVTSLTQSANPSATFTGKNANTGNQSANHTHSGTTASAGSHSHVLNQDHRDQQNLGGSAYYGYCVATATGNSTTSAGAHTHSFTTGGNSTNHTHNYTPAGKVTLSGNHTHSLTASGSISTPTFTGTAGTTGSVGNSTSIDITDPYITVHIYERIG